MACAPLPGARGAREEEVGGAGIELNSEGLGRGADADGAIPEIVIGGFRERSRTGVAAEEGARKHALPDGDRGGRSISGGSGRVGGIVRVIATSGRVEFRVHEGKRVWLSDVALEILEAEIVFPGYRATHNGSAQITHGEEFDKRDVRFHEPDRLAQNVQADGSIGGDT